MNWFQRKMCRHQKQPAYEEIRSVSEDGMVSFVAAWFCPDCDEVLGVEASCYGDIRTLERAIKEERA